MDRNGSSEPKVSLISRMSCEIIAALEEGWQCSKWQKKKKKEKKDKNRFPEPRAEILAFSLRYSTLQPYKYFTCFWIAQTAANR